MSAPAVCLECVVSLQQSTANHTWPLAAGVGAPWSTWGGQGQREEGRRGEGVEGQATQASCPSTPCFRNSLLKETGLQRPALEAGTGTELLRGVNGQGRTSSQRQGCPSLEGGGQHPPPPQGPGAGPAAPRASIPHHTPPGTSEREPCSSPSPESQVPESQVPSPAPPGPKP